MQFDNYEPPIQFITAVPQFTNARVQSLNYTKIGFVSNFSDLCSFCGDHVEYMLTSFIANKVAQKPYRKPTEINWPEEIMRYKLANCVDISIMMRYYFDLIKFKHYIVFVGYMSTTTGEVFYGHAFPAFCKLGKYYIWNYYAKGIGDINGPFETMDDLGEAASGYFLVMLKSLYLTNSAFNKPNDFVITDYAYLNSSDLKIIDEVRKKNGDDKETEQKEIFDIYTTPKLKEMASRLMYKFMEYHGKHGRVPSPIIFKTLPIINKSASIKSIQNEFDNLSDIIKKVKKNGILIHG